MTCDDLNQLDKEIATLREENKILKEQLEINEGWFREINILCECPEDDPAVNSVNNLREVYLKVLPLEKKLLDLIEEIRSKIQ